MKKTEMEKMITEAIKNVGKKHVERDKWLRENPDFGKRAGGFATEILETIRGMEVVIIPGQLEEIIIEVMLLRADTIAKG